MTAPEIGLSDVRDDAVHGSYCPKMCNFACPVTAATGRESDTPWGLHVTVAELATGRREPDASSYDALTGCTGCHACRAACLYEQDVPAQVRAARSAHDPRGRPAVQRILEELQEGRSPYGRPRLELAPTDATPDLQLVAGCRDGRPLVDAVLRLLRSAGRRPRVVAPDGCCGALLTDLGLTDEADDLRDRLAEQLDPQLATVSTDPHCLEALRTIVDAPVHHTLAELDQLLDGGELRFSSTRTTHVTYHDPCVLARDEGATQAPRRLLAAAGLDVLDPRRSGSRTACSGAGMGMDVLDAGSAGAVAARRVEELAGPEPVVTACGRAGAVLSQAGADVRDIHLVLAERILGEDDR